MTDKDLLPPGIDPKTAAIGIRRVAMQNAASTRSVMTVRGHELITDEPASDTGPTPLETALAALMGCEGVIINRCAEAMGFAYSAVEIEGEGEVDRRGSRGVPGVRPYFNWVKLEIRVHPALIGARTVLANVSGVLNAVLLEGEALGPCLVYGRGAGDLPTAVSVVSDILDVARSIARGASWLDRESSKHTGPA